MELPEFDFSHPVVHLDKNTDYFYRVRHPQGATYWNYVRLSADAAYTVTEEDLGLTGDFNKATAVLTIKNLPASVLTGSDVIISVLVTCNI